jgi:hypothetical protein
VFGGMSFSVIHRVMIGAKTMLTACSTVGGVESKYDIYGFRNHLMKPIVFIARQVNMQDPLFYSPYSD